MIKYAEVQQLLQQLFLSRKKEFVKGVFFNLVSSVILGVNGILQNILIGNYYKVDGLGIFSWSLAGYMICSIFSTFGIQTSVVKFVAEYQEDVDNLNKIISAALWLVLFFSATTTLVLFLLLQNFPNRLAHQETLPVFRNILIGLPFFSLNKVLMSILNGLRRMQAFALIQSTRAIFLIIFTLFFIYTNKPLNITVLMFLFTEIILFLCLLSFYCVTNLFSFSIIPDSFWLKQHLFFGGKSAFTNSIGELNKNIDILMLGYFSTNYYVGIYSFASTAAKGFFMISSIIQMNFNPIISYTYSKYGIEQLVIHMNKLFKITFFTAIITVILVMTGYPILIYLFVKDTSFYVSIPICYILLCGVAIIWIFCFSGAILVMCGYATEQFQLMVIVLLFNIVCNILLIPIIGIYGAAISTTLSYIILIIMLNYLVKNKLNIDLIRIFMKSLTNSFV